MLFFMGNYIRTTPCSRKDIGCIIISPTFYINLRDISKFELRNNISINVHTLESNFENDKIVYRVVGPLYYSQKKLHICTYQFAANNHIRNISVMGAYYILVMKTYYFNINKMTAIIYIRQYRQEKLKRTNTELTHEPYSFAYLIKYSFNDSLSKFELYRGANAANVFVKKTDNYLTRIYENYLKPIIPMEHLTREK
ncbi:hypothetical protein NQ318_014638 [Aromia moschata]|uniref:Uncharacterized protein n=1 Tax=Aromia moschata TaxID=1265417 RepID=A0AAV8ZAY4_9CUCU|nr:hypothetical protein NQ318_014638 [Aromia moschata]